VKEPPELPQARVRQRRWRLSVVWIVPIVAAIVAGYLTWGRLQELGPTITIQFTDVTGVRAGQTEIRYRGVPVGRVVSVELSDDEKSALVKARLRPENAALAKDGSVFWIVRPDVRSGDLSRLSTIVSGPYIEISPGGGKARSKFVGLASPPPVTERAGLRIVLEAPNLGSVRPGSPVYYRGIEVGAVARTDLRRDATAADAHVVVFQRYARLVRIGSRFWTVSGVDVNVSLLKGLEISVDSLRSLVSGAIAFATPDDANMPAAKDGTIFALHDKPQKEWLDWRPRIPVD
jgi:paraquat-inducible protein B